MTTELTINQLREKIVENRKNGLPPDEGIDREDIRDAIKSLRSTRVFDPTKTTKGKSTVKKKTAKATSQTTTTELNDLLGLGNS